MLNGGLPTDEMSRLKELPEYEQYTGLGTYYYGFNLKNIPDLNQRKAMSLAVDRRTLIDNVFQGDQLPATGMTPKGMPGFDAINPESPWAPESADMEQAKQLMEEVAQPEDEHHALRQRLARPPRGGGRRPGAVEGARDREHDQAAGVPAVPGVPRAAAEQRRRRLPARLDRRLRRRDQLPRALDVRLGQQQHDLLQRGVRREDRGGPHDRGQRRPLRALRRGGGDPVRRGRRAADHPGLLLHVQQPGKALGEGQLQPEPARPGRPDPGRRYRGVTRCVRTGVGLPPRPRSGILEVGRD